VHDLSTPLGRLGPLLVHQTGRPLLLRRRLDALLRERPYDILHFHNISLLGPAVLGIEAPDRRPLKLYTAHEHWLVCPTHVLWKLEREVCERPECLRCTLHARRPPQIWRHTGLLSRAAACVDQFLAPSRSAAREHAERGFTQPMRVVPLFADSFAQPECREAPRPHATPYFLFVGRLEAIKGLQTLLPLWPRVGDVDLLIAGAGTYEPALRALAARNPRVRFLGHVPQEALGPLYAHAIACLVPSITCETFGMIAIESFMHRTPVIARNLGSLTEIVTDSGGGVLYRTDDELVRAIEALRSDGSLRDRLGDLGHRAYLERWTRAAHLHEYYRVARETAARVLGRVPWEE
jgi:glycosyltransferase involved in cell wall biosynthesis